MSSTEVDDGRYTDYTMTVHGEHDREAVGDCFADLMEQVERLHGLSSTGISSESGNTRDGDTHRVVLAQRDQARRIAVALEQEVAELTRRLAEVQS